MAPASAAIAPRRRLRMGETVSGEDDRACSGKSQDTCSSALELSIVQIGLETYRSYEYENEMHMGTFVEDAL